MLCMFILFHVFFLLEKLVSRPFVHYSMGFFGFLVLICLSSLYILDPTPLLDAPFVNPLCSLKARIMFWECVVSDSLTLQLHNILEKV